MDGCLEGGIKLELLRCATQLDIPALRRLWQRAFGDTEAEMRCFFDVCPPEKISVLEASGALCSMTVAFPAELHCVDGSAIPAVYLFAVATEPEARRRGYAARTLAHAELRAAEDGARYGVLMPATAPLRDYYAGLGYVPWCTRSVQTVSVQPNKSADRAVPTSVERYLALRAACLGGRGHLTNGPLFYEYARRLLALMGGGFYELELGGQRGCCCAIGSGARCYVPELLTPAGLEYRGLSALARQVPAEQYRFCTLGPGEPFGMAHALTPDAPPLPMPGWLGIALD